MLIASDLLNNKYRIKIRKITGINGELSTGQDGSDRSGSDAKI
jgi:hypothetical protein